MDGPREARHSCLTDGERTPGPAAATSGTHLLPQMSQKGKERHPSFRMGSVLKRIGRIYDPFLYHPLACHHAARTREDAKSETKGLLGMWHRAELTASLPCLWHLTPAKNSHTGSVPLSKVRLRSHFMPFFLLRPYEVIARARNAKNDRARARLPTPPALQLSIKPVTWFKHWLSHLLAV